MVPMAIITPMMTKVSIATMVVKFVKISSKSTTEAVREKKYAYFF